MAGGMAGGGLWQGPCAEDLWLKYGYFSQRPMGPLNEHW